MNSIIINSFAKINLGLLVKEKRPDGYHNIETIFVPIRLSDKILLKKTDQKIVLKLPGRGIKIPKGKANLAYKAAELFFNKTKIKQGVAIRIEKNIPVGAGLGGGSSNAAMVLRGLNILSGNLLTKKDLSNLALKIGMDVPFFLTGQACYAMGRGEILKPIKIPKLNMVLYFSGYPIITKWAYENIAKIKFPISNTRPSSSSSTSRGRKRGGLTNGDLSLKILREKLVNGDLRNLQRQIRNNFEDLIFAYHPDLAEVKEFFLTNGAYAASLSGSGSAIFGLVKRNKIAMLKTALKRNKIEAVFTESISS